MTKLIRGTPVAREFAALYERLVGRAADRAPAQGELFPHFRTVLATRSQLAIDYSQHEALLQALCRNHRLYELTAQEIQTVIQTVAEASR